MKDFGRLIVTGAPDGLRNLVPTIEEMASGSGWRRNHELENKLARRGIDELYAFSCNEARGRRAAHLWLSVAHDQARVTNIVPAGAGSLDYDDITPSSPASTRTQPRARSGSWSSRPISRSPSLSSATG